MSSERHRRSLYNPAVLRRSLLLVVSLLAAAVVLRWLAAGELTASAGSEVATVSALPTPLAQLRRPGLPARRLLLVGWDAADWHLLDQQLAAGKMPNLAGLIARGATANLHPLKPMISPLIWTSIVTGVTPDVHGILDFLRPQPGGKPVPVTSADRKVPALWNVLSAAGISVGAVGFWATWPAEPVRGFLVSDRVAYQLSELGGVPQEALVYPPELWGELAGERVAETDIGYDQVARLVHISQPDYEAELASGRGYKDPVIFLRRLLASTETYHRLALAGWRRYQPQALLVYFEGTDTIAHMFAPYAPPKRDQVTQVEFDRFRDAGALYYQDMDARLGELLAAVGPDADVLLCSDHGFAWGEGRPQGVSDVHTATAAWWHRDPGVLVMAGPAFRHLTERGSANVLDLAPTLLALAGLPPGRGMSGKVLGWALAQDVATGEPVDYAATLGAPAAPATPLPDLAADEVVAQLEALGYLEPGEEKAPQPAATPTPAETPWAVLNLGTVLLEQGRNQEALEAYRKAVELDPEQAGSWIKLGIAQHRLGLLEESLESNRRAIKLSKAEVHVEAASLGMAIALAELGREADALMLLEAATTFVPTSFILWKTRGDVELKQGDQKLARDAYAKAVELSPDTECLNRLAALVLQLDGDRERARTLWQRSLQLDPKQPRVEEALAALAAEDPAR